MKFVDITPTWTAILPTWLMMYRQAIEGHCTDPDLVRSNATAEFERMAVAADRWNAFCKDYPAATLEFQTNRLDLFPPDADDAASYESVECPDCRGTGCEHLMGEVMVDEPCEACSGAGTWLACTECGEPQFDDHLLSCYSGRVEESFANKGAAQ